MRLLLLPIGAVLVLSLAACAPAASTSSSPAATGRPSVGASADSGRGSTAAINVCSKISVGTVVSTTTRTVYTTAHEIDGPSEGATVFACEYTDSTDAADALDGINLVVYRGGDPTAIMKSLAGAQTDPPVVHSGIGDRAQLGAGELDVVVGTDVVVVSDSVHEGQLAELTTAQLEKLAHLVMALL